MAKPSINGIGKHTPGGYIPGGWRGVEQSEYFLNYNLINYRNVTDKKTEVICPKCKARI